MYRTVAILIALVGGISVEGCADCYRYHPQQVFCDADFVVRILVTSTKFNVRIPNNDNAFYNLLHAELVKDLKPGRVEIGDTLEFYNPTSICGTWFDQNTEYLVTGSLIESDNGTKYLLHGNCGFSAEWEDLSSKQQKGFEFKYGRMCGCQVIGVKSDMTLRVTELDGGAGYEGARSYWTPHRCYYNPYKTERYHREDCEEEFGFCKADDDGICKWQMTSDYESCFSERETFVLALEGSPAFTDISQCEVLRNRRQRRKCRKRVKQNARNLEMEVNEEKEE